MADGAFRDPTNILDYIYDLESSRGTDPKRLVPNEEGALGSYQIRPGAFSDIQRNYKSKWADKDFETVALDDTQAREAANDYLKVIAQHYINQGLAPTFDALLAGYHGGMGTVAGVKAKNQAPRTVGPKTGDYLNKAHRLRALMTGGK